MYLRCCVRPEMGGNAATVSTKLHDPDRHGMSFVLSDYKTTVTFCSLVLQFTIINGVTMMHKIGN
jgi:hypothetical protein